VAFYVYFNVMPSAACFVDFTQDSSWAWHFWMHPDSTSLYAVFNNYGAVIKLQRGLIASTWYHITYVYDLSAVQVTAYLNGGLVGAGTVGAAAIKSAFNKFSIGRRITGEAYQGSFDGSMYCLKFFNRTLTDGQVNDVMRSCVNGKVSFDD
jgi:hypothetical protein